MDQPKTTRPFQERFLDNFDRSQLRREVEAVKPKRFAGLRKKYVTWALGASLAVGGIGAPLKMLQSSTGTAGNAGTQTTSKRTTDGAIDQALATDLKSSLNIASEVAGGVAGGVQAAVSGVQQVAEAPLKAVTEAPKKLTMVTENVREDFFKSEVPFGSIIYKEAKKQNLRPELVAAVVQAESKFKPTAHSGAGAIGLMQLVPKTGRWMGARNLHNPAENVAAGAKYLKYLHERFNGDETKVIAAYNAGEGNVKRFGGVPPFRETRNYVAKVQNFERDYHDRVAGRVADAGLMADAR
ncbi:MAG TPA: lytic transglycosylase domain-containing protein [Thermoanaerobaculia bacterium]|nr:lytic transglycosylase domain-containing protein [Thermoanaerobaculia bacterium]